MLFLSSKKQFGLVILVDIKLQSIQFSEANKLNLCQEGYNLFVEISDTQGNGGDGSNLWFSDVELICRCDATTQRVPCTVYYFP